MKRLTTFLLAACNCFTVGIMFTGCDDAHTVTTPTALDWERAFSTAVEADQITYTWHQIGQKGDTSYNDGFMTVYKDGDKLFIEGGCGADGGNCYTSREGNNLYHYTENEDNLWSKSPIEALPHISPLNDVLDPFVELYDAFVFDDETKMFNAASIEIMGMDMEVDVNLENGYLTYLRFKFFSGYVDEEPTWLTTIYQFSEYGTTIVTLPEMNEK